MTEQVCDTILQVQSKIVRTIMTKSHHGNNGDSEALWRDKRPTKTVNKEQPHVQATIPCNLLRKLFTSFKST